MIQFLRKFIDSRWGIYFALGFLILIALAFAAGDMAGMNTGGSAKGDTVAQVGKEKITAAQLSQAATNALENMKQQEPQLTMKAFVANGGLDKVLDQMIDRAALGAFGRKYGIIASERLIDSEIAKVPAFKGVDGKFNENVFRTLIQQRGMTEAAFREDIALGLIARQLLLPAETGAVIPRDAARRYAALLTERRAGSVAILPAGAFAPRTPPTEAELQAFYDKNKARFTRPERRVIRYASFGETALKPVAPPTDADLAARYTANREKYAALETRSFTQLIVPTEAAAKAVIAELSAGKGLEQAAAAKGLSTAKIESRAKPALAAQATPAVADAVFSAAQGTVAVPARSAIGWHVIRVDRIEKRAERTLEQVKPELAAAIQTEKRHLALNDLAERLDTRFGEGGNLAEAAKELGLTLQQTAPVTADGNVYGQGGASLPKPLARLTATAFSMERENQPQIAEVEAGKTFAIFDVTAITPSAPAPFTEIKGDVTMLFVMDKGSAGAKSAADKVLAAARKGSDLAAAMASLRIPLPPIEQVDLGREQLAVYKDKVPAPLMLLFSMAKGTVKLIPAPDNQAWLVVALKSITPGKVEETGELMDAAQTQLSQLTGNEYAQQLTRAIRTMMNVTRNEAALKSVRDQLAGTN